jgi:branched-chain amino acid transport system substrate-binding protein
MRHLTVSVAGAAVLTLVLSACGSGDSATTGGSGSALTGSGTGDSCKITKPVPVGAVFSLTGAAASYGVSQQKGLELAAAELKTKGGVTYDVKIEDDATDPKQGIAVFERFVTKDKKSVIIGPTLSNAAKQTDPVAQEGKTPVLGVSNTAAGITEIGDYVFRDSLTEDAVIPQTIKAAKGKFGLSKVVVLYSNDDAFTESGFQAFKKALDANGVTISKTITFSKSDTDFRAQLAVAKASAPDALVVSALVEAAVPLVTQAREVGIDAPIIGGNGFNSPKLMAGAGKSADGVVVGAAWNSASSGAENAAFLTAYRAKHSADPDQFAAQAYTGLKLVDVAVRAGCSGERADIKKHLGELKAVPTALGLFTMTSTRDAEHPAVVQVVENGKFAVLK